MKTIDIYKIHEEYKKQKQKVLDENKQRRSKDGYRNEEEKGIESDKRDKDKEMFKRYDEQLAPEEACILEQLKELKGRPMVFKPQKLAFIRTLDVLQL